MKRDAFQPLLPKDLKPGDLTMQVGELYLILEVGPRNYDGFLKIKELRLSDGRVAFCHLQQHEGVHTLLLKGDERLP